jgi:hypothetical protein
VHGRSGNMWKNDKAVLHLPVIHQVVKTILRFSFN